MSGIATLPARAECHGAQRREIEAVLLTELSR
jgi:hypothetical protein